MANQFQPAWMRDGMFYARQTAWGTATILSDDFYRVREETGITPPIDSRTQSYPANTGGRGIPGNQAAYYYSGRHGGGFGTSHPYTHKMAKDFLYMFFNGKQKTTVPQPPVEEYNCRVLDDGAANALLWAPEINTDFATIRGALDNDDGTYSEFAAEGCFPRALSIICPDDTAGETGGRVLINPDWIFRSASEVAALGTSVEDVTEGAYMLSHNCNLKESDTAYEFETWQLDLTNGAMLRTGQKAAAAYSPGVIIGDIHASGSIVALANNSDDAGFSLAQVLLAAWDAKTVLDLDFIIANGGAPADTLWTIPAVITAEPTRADRGGFWAYTFQFQEAVSASSHILCDFEGGSNNPTDFVQG